MTELYVKVRQPEVLLRNNYTIKNRVDALYEAAKVNIHLLKLFINTNYNEAVLSTHYLTPALTIILDENKYDIPKVLQTLREQPYVEVAEQVNS